MDRKYQASVKVMRSYDYCHFEVALSTDEPLDLDEVNVMRKQAALLADEAVRQYRIAKEKEGRRISREYERNEHLRRLEFLQAKPESELAPHEAAELRAYADQLFWKSYEDDDYMYQDEPEREHHFSMLRKFKDTTVRPQ